MNQILQYNNQSTNEKDDCINSFFSRFLTKKF